MEIIYITQDDCQIHRCGGHLTIKKDGTALGSVPLETVRTIIVFGRTQITAQAVELLFDKQIDVVYMTKSGNIKGRVSAEKSGGATLRLAQYDAYKDTPRRLQIAREIIRAKITNQKKLICKYKYYNASKEYDEAIAQIDEYTQKLSGADEISGIMGIEGAAAKVYWAQYAKIFKEPVFTRRAYRPAPDFVNSALNLSYAFLATETASCLSAAGLDPDIGFLHSIRGARSSLALDIMEEFRAPFADGWILSLVNKKILREEFFKGPNDGFYLKDKGFAKFCALYHEHREEGGWSGKIRKQADLLRKAVAEGTAYIPYYHE